VFVYHGGEKGGAMGEASGVKPRFGSLKSIQIFVLV